ncbi:hypothetical protein [Kitasatospora fiedleri]|uniref:hypothetical protein n=1 Tax=Kitasatospora fiedleri TaxID=2991545 RepID=UPI002499F4D0|nr:hypothetical protein [Kitasatospora fiedleri]
MTAPTEAPSRTPEGFEAFPHPLDRSGYVVTAGTDGARAGGPAGPGSPCSPHPPRFAVHPLAPDDAGTAPAATAPATAPTLRGVADPVPGHPA